jgi:ubiquinone/menaquinone biosynthesis C-methylase UbiE
MLTHEQAKAFYDRLGSRQDTQGFYEEPAVAALVDHLAPASARMVMEVGCGTGRLAASLLARHLPPDAHYLGLDVSSTMVALSRRRLARFGLRAEVRQTSGEMRFGAPAASRDRFLAVYLLDLLTEPDIRSLLAEAHRLLVPGGLLGLVSLTCGFSPLSRVVATLWTALHRLHPALVGGCRPLRLKHFVGAGWTILHRQKVAPFGVPSEVMVAARA